MKTITLLIAVFLAAGCSTVPDPADDEPAAECPAVACSWAADGSCPEETSDFSSQNIREDLDGGGTCWTFKATCIPAGVDPACVPDNCAQNQFTTCTR